MGGYYNSQSWESKPLTHPCVSQQTCIKGLKQLSNVCYRDFLTDVLVIVRSVLFVSNNIVCLDSFL